jgi:hypothetical protein
MLVAQGALFIYTTDRIAGSMPAPSPRRLAVLVASDLSSALNADPSLDVSDYVQDQYSKVFQPFIVLMVDGREVSNHPSAIPDDVRVALRREMLRGELPARGRVFVPRRTDDDRFAPGGPRTVSPWRIRGCVRQRRAGRHGGRAAGATPNRNGRPRAGADDGARCRGRYLSSAQC